MVANNHKEEFKRRSKELAKRTLLFVDGLPSKPGARVIANQLGRSAGSVAANYRAACRVRSRAEFIAKLGIVEEESDESIPLANEMNELLSITIASIKTARQNEAKSSRSAVRNPKSEIQ